MNKLRTKSTTYKKKKMELSGLRAELGVLARTEEVLNQRHDALDRKLVSVNCYQSFHQSVTRLFQAQIGPKTTTQRYTETNKFKKKLQMVIRTNFFIQA